MLLSLHNNDGIVTDFRPCTAISGLCSCFRWNLDLLDIAMFLQNQLGVKNKKTRANLIFFMKMYLPNSEKKSQCFVSSE